MTTYLIASFYKFVSLSDIATLKPPLLEAMHANQIKGTIILAEEGVNGSFCGNEDGVAAFIGFLKQFTEFNDLEFCKTYADANPFAKAKVKLRKEIVTMGEEESAPNEARGVYLNPDEWNEALQDPNVVLIDTRNAYEVSLGTFEGAIDPKTDNFRDFPDFVQQELMDKKDKKIAMFCTGGIRCEKSTAYLKKLGFEEVYHLKGGILHYLEKMSKDSQEASLWRGSCFVFDERVALDNRLNSLPRGSIDPEWKNKNRLKSSKVDQEF